MGPAPYYSLSQVESAYQSFRPVAPLSYLAKVTFFGFLNTKRGWPYRHAYDIPLVTLILNIYEFVGLTSKRESQIHRQTNYSHFILYIYMYTHIIFHCVSCPHIKVCIHINISLQFLVPILKVFIK